MTTYEFDPFAPGTSEKYSTENFYSRATDSQGHSRHSRYGPNRSDVIKVPPYLAASIEAFTSCSPLRSVQDVWRDAMVHYLKMRQEQMKDSMPLWWSSAVDQVVASAELDRVEAKRFQHEEIVTKIESVLHNATSSDELSECIGSCEAAAMSLELPEYIRRAGSIIDRYRK